MRKIVLCIVLGMMVSGGALGMEEEDREAIEQAKTALLLNKPYPEASHEELKEMFQRGSNKDWFDYNLFHIDPSRDRADIVSKIRYPKEERRGISPVSYYPLLVRYLEDDLPYIYLGQLVGDPDACALYGTILIRGLDAYGYHIPVDVKHGAFLICQGARMGSYIGRFILEEVGVLAAFRRRPMTKEDYRAYLMAQTWEWYLGAQMMVEEYYPKHMEEIRSLEHLTPDERIEREVKEMMENRRRATKAYFDYHRKKDEEERARAAASKEGESSGSAAAGSAESKE